MGQQGWLIRATLHPVNMFLKSVPSEPHSISVSQYSQLSLQAKQQFSAF